MTASARENIINVARSAVAPIMAMSNNHDVNGESQWRLALAAALEEKYESENQLSAENISKMAQ
jgi:hypothetical protein